MSSRAAAPCSAATRRPLMPPPLLMPQPLLLPSRTSSYHIQAPTRCWHLPTFTHLAGDANITFTVDRTRSPNLRVTFPTPNTQVLLQFSYHTSELAAGAGGTFRTSSTRLKSDDETAVATSPVKLLLLMLLGGFANAVEVLPFRWMYPEF